MKSIPAAKTFVASEAIDEANSIAHSYVDFKNLKLKVHVVINTKDSFFDIYSNKFD